MTSHINRIKLAEHCNSDTERKYWPLPRLKWQKKIRIKKNVRFLIYKPQVTKGIPESEEKRKRRIVANRRYNH